MSAFLHSPKPTQPNEPMQPTRPTLGVAIITLNAARHLAACLSALAFADDIVILDGGSGDDTCEIAQRLGARVEVNLDWQGFGTQKNRAIALLRTDWCLLIDADEVVSPALARSIRDTLDAPQNDMVTIYALDRLSSFCGQWIYHSGWRPDAVERLFKQGTARFSNDRVHERLVFEKTARVETLTGELRHFSYDDIATVLRKLDAYSAAGAQQRLERGAHASFGTALRRGLWAFLRTYFLRRGFLDGQAGLKIAIFNAETVYYRFLRLAEAHDRVRLAQVNKASKDAT